MQLGRGVPTLSGGESQRIRLAAQLGSNLSGVLYMLDEPTIGLHARDNEQLLAALEKLKVARELGRWWWSTMRRRCAGRITSSILGRARACTVGKWWRRARWRNCYGIRSRSPANACGRIRHIRRAGSADQSLRGKSAQWLVLRRAGKNNLKNLTVKFPLGRLVLVTGVSGSGKSTLVRECLLPSRVGPAEKAKRGENGSGGNSDLSGCESIQAVYEVDQSPIGRTPRSIPATYVGFFDEIRQLFSQVPEARLRGYSPSRFSFNSAQGRCPECEGAGKSSWR